MAEYIDRDKVFEAVDKRVDELKGDKQFTLPKEICVRGVMKHLVNIPPADVVEREKIDKAIEELEQHRELSHADFEQYAEENGLSDCEDYHFAGLRTALEILKKHIGE